MPIYPEPVKVSLSAFILLQMAWVATQHGEVASNIAVKTMAEYLIKRLYSPIFGIKPEQQGESFQEIMHKRDCRDPKSCDPEE